jgi:AraC-like DNA-binding protein
VAPLDTGFQTGTIERFVPKEPLRKFVDLIWQCEGLVQPHSLERVLPTGTMGIIINLAEDTSRKYDPRDPRRVETYGGSIVSGPHGGFCVIDTAEQVSVLGVSFNPGGAPPFLAMPGRELRDLHVSLHDVCGKGAHGLRERLLEAESHERFALIESWLLEQAHGDLTRHPAVTYALTQFSGMPHTRSVAEVTDQIGLSSRHFIQLFDEEVGLTPKLFCRIQRFQHAIKLAHQNEDVDWADLAVLAGYYDQSHMIHDFQEFSGLNPSAYLKHRGPHLNHVPLPA